MLTDLREINRLLLAIKQRAFENGATTWDDAVDECKKVVLGGVIPDHNDTIQFCLQCKIIEKNDKLIKPSDFGKNLLRLNDNNEYDLTLEQKEFLARNCFLNGYHKKDLKDVIQQFYADYRKQTFIFSSQNGIPLKVVPIFLSLLKQCNFIQEQDHLLLVNPIYAESVSILLTLKSSLTVEELEERLAIGKDVGKVAEKIVFEFEKQRLRNEFSAKPESDIVQIISSTNVDAGYDINSFDGKSTNLHYDRFIEVKGSTNSLFSIFWSRNEMRIARNLGTKYWIYFVPEVDIKTGTHKGEIIKIQNPAKNILNNDDFQKDCMKTWVRKST